jgi:hypothetical protein
MQDSNPDPDTKLGPKTNPEKIICDPQHCLGYQHEPAREFLLTFGPGAGYVVGGEPTASHYQRAETGDTATLQYSYFLSLIKKCGMSNEEGKKRKI